MHFPEFFTTKYDRYLKKLDMNAVDQKLEEIHENFALICFEWRYFVLY